MLYRAAKADPSRRFHALFDKVRRRDVLDRAWEDVRRNRGAAGIDRVTLEDAEEYGIARLLGVFLVLTMMVGPKISPEGVVAEERRGKAVADLARESGIEHLVYSSLNGASARSGIPYYESKARIEEHIHALRLPATILRPVSFMDNFATYNRPVLDDGELVVSLAVRPELPMQLISVRDIGAFAAIAFDRPDQFLGRTVEIAGDVLTPPQIAETFGRVCGLPARFRQTLSVHLAHGSDGRWSVVFLEPFAPPSPSSLPTVVSSSSAPPS